VVVTINISVKLPLSRDTPHKVKRLVSLPPEERVCSAVPRRSRTEQVASFGVGECDTVIFRIWMDERKDLLDVNGSCHRKAFQEMKDRNSKYPRHFDAGSVALLLVV